MVCVKGETVGMATGPPLQGLPELLFRPGTVCQITHQHLPVLNVTWLLRYERFGRCSEQIIVVIWVKFVFNLWPLTLSM